LSKSSPIGATPAFRYCCKRFAHRFRNACAGMDDVRASITLETDMTNVQFE
jgi:hypothetical protein